MARALPGLEGVGLDGSRTGLTPEQTSRIVAFQSPPRPIFTLRAKVVAPTLPPLVRTMTVEVRRVPLRYANNAGVFER